MKKIYVPKELKVSDLKEYIIELIEENEEVKGKFVGINSVANTMTMTNSHNIDMDVKGDTKFSPFATSYKVVLTDKRVLLIGINGYDKNINGTREIDYNEIEKVLMEKEENLKISLNGGETFYLEFYDEGNNPKVTEEIKNSIKYLEDRIGDKFNRKKIIFF